MKRLVWLFLVFPLAVLAQNDSNDRLLWTSVKVEKDLTKRWNLAAEYQLRLEENMSVLRGHYISVQTDYDLLKYLSVGLEYRFVTAPDRTANRVQLSLTGKVKGKKIGFSWRTAYQRQFEDFVDADTDDKSSDYWRNKFQLKWKFVKNWQAYGAWEPFYRISDNGNKFDRLRYTAGVEWEFINHHSIDLAYLYQPQINRKSPRTFTIISVGYTWKIPGRKKEDKQKKG